METTAVSRTERDRRGGRRRAAAILGLIGLGVLLALAYWWASRQSTPIANPAPVTTVPTTAAPVTTPEPSSVRIARNDETVVVEGTVKTESEREALLGAVTSAGFEVENQITVSPDVDDSDARVVAALLGPLLEGTNDGELILEDGAVTIVGEALDPVEAERIRMAIETATVTGLTVDDQTTVRVLSEEVQILELQKEIDQIFELARAIEGQYPNFDVSVDELGSGATATLDRVVVAMRRYPLPAADIIGHTDSTGSAELNQELSEARAATVMQYLVDAGVETGRLQASGRGASEPVADNSSESGRAENRRVDFLVKKRAG